MRIAKPILFVFCLCIVLFQAGELRALFRDDVDPEKVVQWVEEERERSKSKLEKMRAEERLEQEKLRYRATQQIPEKTTVNSTPAVKDTKTGKTFVVTIIFVIVIIILVVVKFFLSYKHKEE